IDGGGALRIVRQAGEGVDTVRVDAGLRSGSLTVDGAASIGGTITGNGSGLTSLNASNLSSGTVPDARLSSNVPLLNVANTFTKSGTELGSAAIAIAANTPNFLMHETDQPEDGRLWAFSLAGKNFRLGAVADAYSGSIPGSSLVFNVARSGADVSSIAIGSGLGTSTITLNGVNVTDYARLSQANTFTGPATFSAASPRVEFFETDVGADEGRWRLFAADGRFGIQARDDGSTVGSTFMA